MSTVDKTKLIPLTLAPPYIPGNPHIATIVRWSLRGIKSPNGNRVKLATRKIGGRWFTSQEWIEEFICGLNCDDVNRKRLDERRAQIIAKEEQELDAEGIV